MIYLYLYITDESSKLSLGLLQASRVWITRQMFAHHDLCFCLLTLCFMVRLYIKGHESESQVSSSQIDFCLSLSSLVSPGWNTSESHKVRSIFSSQTPDTIFTVCIYMCVCVHCSTCMSVWRYMLWHVETFIFVTVGYSVWCLLSLWHLQSVDSFPSHCVWVWRCYTEPQTHIHHDYVTFKVKCKSTCGSRLIWLEELLLLFTVPWIYSKHWSNNNSY